MYQYFANTQIKRNPIMETYYYWFDIVNQYQRAYFPLESWGKDSRKDRNPEKKVAVVC